MLDGNTSYNETVCLLPTQPVLQGAEAHGPCSLAPASARPTPSLLSTPLPRGPRALKRGGGGGSQVFEETPLGKRREALAEANGWFDGNPAFGRVRITVLRDSARLFADGRFDGNPALCRVRPLGCRSCTTSDIAQNSS